MTQFEKDEALRALNEDQIEQRATMADSDAHADQCIKLGVKFKTAYPDEYTVYVAARTKFHENEEEIARIEAIVPEEPEHPEQSEEEQA